MKRSTKIALFTAITFIILGCLFSAAALFAIEFDFTKLDTSDFVTNTYTVEEGFTNISVDIDTCDVEFVLSPDNTCKVVCDESKKLSYEILVKNDTLSISLIDGRDWFDFIGFGFDSTEMLIYLPAVVYNSLSIDSSTGDISVPKDFSFESVKITCSTADVDFRGKVNNDLSIKTDTGDIKIIDSDAGTINVSVSTGDVDIKDVTCENITVKSSTGDVTLTESDANMINIKSSTGDVWCSLLSGKVFTVKTSTGDRSVPADTMGQGTCHITTSTGDIKVIVK